MKVGIKFCGGCNPRYERGNFAKKISEEFEGKIEFEYAKEDNKYDGLLIISGCTSNCADYSRYDKGKGIVFATEEASYESVVNELKKLLNK